MSQWNRVSPVLIGKHAAVARKAQNFSDDRGQGSHSGWLVCFNCMTNFQVPFMHGIAMTNLLCPGCITEHVH
jgi:hypothetical protein